MSFYQDFPVPARSASSDAVPATATRRVLRRIKVTSNRKLTALRSYTPFGGESKRLTKVSVRETRSVLWAITLSVSAVGVAVWLRLEDYGLPSLWIVAGLALIAGLAERHSVSLLGDRQNGIEIAVSFVPLLFTAVAFGPLTALFVGVLGNLGDLRAPYLRWAVYTPARGLTFAAAGLAAGEAHSPAAGTFVSILVAALIASCAHLLVDVVINMATLRIRRSASPLSYPRAMLPLFFLSVPLYIPVVAFLVYGYEHYSIAVVGTFLVPVLALQRVAHLYQEQRQAASELARANSRLERANLSFAAALVATLDARDRYTAGHSAAVAIYSRDIASRMGLEAEDQGKAHLAGLVHDIGKIGLPPGLLEKPGPLTLEERRLMQQHSAIGERILRNVDDYAEVAEIVRHHHERVDGNGYPDGLVGDEVPLIARIIAVADAYNAMTSDRPYREAMPSPVARLRLAQAVGTQFDTSVVAAFEAILATSEEAYRMGLSRDFDFAAQESVDGHTLAGVA